MCGPYWRRVLASIVQEDSRHSLSPVMWKTMNFFLPSSIASGEEGVCVITQKVSQNFAPGILFNARFFFNGAQLLHHHHAPCTVGWPNACTSNTGFHICTIVRFLGWD